MADPTMHSVPVLFSWELPTTPFQLRLEHLFVSPFAEFLQTHTAKNDQPSILNVRAVCQLYMDNQKFSNPVISDNSHLEIFPLNEPKRNEEPEEKVSAGLIRFSAGRPPCYLVRFTSVLTFPLNISDLSMDARVDLSFRCSDLELEIGRISLRLFSSAGVFRQGRFLLPLGNGSPSFTDTEGEVTRAESPHQRVCGQCAAASRLVSTYGCLGEESDGSNDWDSCSIGSSSMASDAPAQSLLAAFLGESSTRRKRRIHRHRSSSFSSSDRQKLPSLNPPSSPTRKQRSSSEQSFRSCDGHHSEDSSVFSDGILISSESITCWSSSDEWPSEESDSSCNSKPSKNSSTKNSSKHWRKSAPDQPAADSPEFKASRRVSEDRDSFLLIKSSSESVSHSSKRDSSNQRSAEKSASSEVAESTPSKKVKRVCLQTFRGVCSSVYRAMNCYKLLDLLARGSVPKCPYSKAVCREQVQSECEKHLIKALQYFGFCSLCLPTFSAPVLFSTTPQSREEHGTHSLEKVPQESSTLDWLASMSSESQTDRPCSKSVRTPVDPLILIGGFGTKDSHSASTSDVPLGRSWEENVSRPLGRTVPRRYSAYQERFVDDCSQWYLDTLGLNSWENRQSILASTHHVVVHSAIEESFRVPSNSSLRQSDMSRSLSVPSVDMYYSLPQSNKSTPNVAWAANSNQASLPWASTPLPSLAGSQHAHNLGLLRRCWQMDGPPPHLLARSFSLEAMFVRQQRKLTIASMDRQRMLDEAAIEEGKLGFGSLGAAANVSPAQLSEQQLLDATIDVARGPGSLTPADKRLLWKHRESLRSEGVSVLKLAAAVDWSSPVQAAEFAALLEKWPPPPIENALELLSFLAKIPTVRHFGCRALDFATDEEICRYLPQLVQAIRYDVPVPNAPVLTFLLRRASQCPRLASSLHWCLQCETEDPEKGHLFIRGHQRLMETLAKTPDIGHRALRGLELQRRFVASLRTLGGRIRERKDRADRRTERLREIISSPVGGDESLQLSNLNPPIPLPIAPYGLLLGVITEKSYVVRSSLYPIVLACRVLVPPSSAGAVEDTDQAWGAADVSVADLKERGWVEILKKYMFKTGDDLRQDQLVTQLIRLIRDLLVDYGCDYRLTVYDVVPFSRSDGLVEFVEKSEALSSIKKTHPTLRHFFAAYSHDAKSPLGFPKSVLDTFIRSCSAYSVITFLLGVGDRHLDNLLLREDGRLFHVDFGFILGEDPKPFPPPMKLCSEMVEGLGGIGSEGYTTFQLLCCQCFRCIRRHSKSVLDVLLLMAHSGIRGLKTDPLGTISRVQQKFQLEVTEVEAEAFLLDIIGVSATALFPAVVDKFHEWALYWK